MRVFFGSTKFCAGVAENVGMTTYSCPACAAITRKTHAGFDRAGT